MMIDLTLKMHKFRIRDLAFVALAIVLTCGASLAQNRVGMVVSISGAAELRDADGTKHRLTGQNYAVSLSVGQTLKAEGNGQVQIKLCNGRTETVKNRIYRVAQIVCSSTDDQAKRSVFLNTFNFGGRYRSNRGGDEFILFPLEKRMTVIRPETALFRWVPITGKVTLLVTVAGDRTPAWTKEVDGAAGWFASAELSELLRKIQETKPGAVLNLKVAVPSLSTENNADFRVFSKADEKLLEKDLAQFAGDQTVFQAIARSEVFSKYGLFLEIASELESALKRSPDSVDLLNATAAAQDMAGNIKRRDELVARSKGQKF